VAAVDLGIERAYERLDDGANLVGCHDGAVEFFGGVFQVFIELLLTPLAGFLAALVDIITFLHFAAALGYLILSRRTTCFPRKICCRPGGDRLEAVCQWRLLMH